MFFELVRKNSIRNRKDNGLFFTSLIISIIAFYIILSLENQDVIIFLFTMESDALNRLFQLIPVLYAGSLLILFFLIYFSGKYQLERRNHEFGMYLMMGMQRKKFFLMLLMEDVWNSLVSLLIGIPCAVFLSEMISLITAKVVGLGIIGHKFSLSIQAIGWTIAGYFFIRLVSLLILSGSICRKEVMQLLADSQEKKQKTHNHLFTFLQLICGVLFLAAAYGMAIEGRPWSSAEMMGITAVLGLSGTFFLFHGLGILFEAILKSKKNKNGLAVFTFRQLQENVCLKPNSLGASSILVLAALCCFGYGVSVSLGSDTGNQHVIDYTFQGEKEEIDAALGKPELQGYIDRIFEVRTRSLHAESGTNTFSGKELLEAVEGQKDSEDKEILMNNLQYFTSPYLISLTGYNQILELAGKAPLKLGEHQAALYNDPDFSNGNSPEIIGNALQDKVYVEINKERYELSEEFCQENLVTDRSINISYGLIVPDHVFDRLMNGDYSSYWNAILNEKIVQEKGLMQAIKTVNALLDETSLNYESYLQNIGRQLFYTVAASYTTIYLAVIFLMIANTVIGVQFLMQQQKTGKRYQTIIRLGCSYQQLCKSARKQISWYFFFPVIVGGIGSIFGVRSLLSGIVASSMQGKTGMFMAIAVSMILLLCMVELCYILGVMRMSDKRIHALLNVKREDT